MKKIILIIILLVSVKCYSQSYTFSLDTNKVTLTSLYNALVNAGVFPDSTGTSMARKTQYYTIVCKGDSAFKVGFDTSFTSYMQTETSPPWNYVGEFKSANQQNVWFRKLYSENTAVTCTVSFIKIVR